MQKIDLNDLSIDEKIGQLFLIGLPTSVIDPISTELLSLVKPGGVCLFARNIKEEAQTRQLNDEIVAQLSVHPFLSVDEEGGLVDRLRRVMGPMPAPARITDREMASLHAKIIAGSLSQLGFNMDFAPVVDVIDAERAKFQNGLQSRAFGSSAVDVVALAGDFLDTLQENGIIGCLKHFPGLGASEVDSHEELPTVSIDSDTFENVDLHPYKALFLSGSADCVMVAHAAFPDLALQETAQDGKLLPSSLSFNIVSHLLRDRMKFDGLVLSDDLEMGAIVKNFGIGEAAVMAILAGNDMVSICAGVDAIRSAHSAVSEAVGSGRITGERLNASVERILKLKARIPDPVDFDTTRIASFKEEISQLDQSLA